MAKPWFEIVPHTVRKGETMKSIAAARGFSGSAAAKIYKAKYNSIFRKSNPNPNDLNPGDVVYLPNLTVAQVDEIWQAANDLEWTIDDQMGTSELQRRIQALDSKIGDMELAVEDLADAFSTTSRHAPLDVKVCQRVMKKNRLKIGEMARCVVEAGKWNKVQNDMDKMTSALIGEQHRALKAARDKKKVLEATLKKLAEVASKIRDGAAKTKHEALMARRSTF